MTKIEASSGHKQTIFLQDILSELVILGIYGRRKKQNTSLFTKLTKYGKGKFHSLETEIDAQACNVSYILCFGAEKWFKSRRGKN